MTDYKPAKVVSEILRTMAAAVKPGVTLIELDKIGEAKMLELGATSYNKGYKPEWSKTPYPAVTCISVNSVIAHGIPNEYALREGDIANLDIGIKIDGLCGDASMMVGVGTLSNQDERLLWFAKKATFHMASLLKNGMETEELARKMQRFIYDKGHYSINRKFAGHRIAEEMHMHPNVYPVFDELYEWGTVKTGEIYCLEPIITAGKDERGGHLTDGWGMATLDGKKSAHWEIMVQIRENDCEILTDHIEEVKE